MNSALSDDSSPAGERPGLSHSADGLPLASGASSVSHTHTHVPGLATPIENDRTVISQRPVAAPAEFIRSLSLVELSKQLEGRSLDHFAVDRMIGGGGMGAVFRGRDLRLDREVAIKVIPESRRDPETLRRFRMEAQSAARLDHPNIARVFDIGENETWNYIVFEFIDGINLRDLVLMNGPMSVDDAVFTTRQVAEALQHAHDRHVVHRDIKPSNVIITPNGIAKVVDMGLARNTALDQSTADQTASGVTLGTFDYISPEQARDPRDADVRSDLYSLGCTLFYMLTAQPPFPDGTALQKLLNHGSQPPPDPRQWRDDISDQLAAVLSKLMAKRPSDRYQRPVELINDLLLIAQIESLPRSGSAGTVMISPTIAQRSLLELNLPWLVPLCVLIGSVFWIQSADSFSNPLEVPQPELKQPPLINPIAKDSTARPPQQTGAAIVNAPSANTDKSPSVSAKAPQPITTLETDRPKIVAPIERTNDTREAIVRNETTERSSKTDGNSTTSKASVTEPSNSEDSRGASSKSGDSAAAQGATSKPPSGDGPVGADVVVVSEQPLTNARWANSLSAALMQAAMTPEIRVIELSQSIELTSPIVLPRSGLTLRSASGAKAEIILTGSDAFGMAWETWFEVDRKTFRCQGVRFRCLNDMRQPQAIFAVRPGGKVELDDCLVTMDISRDAMVGTCVLVKDAPKSGVGPTAGSTGTSPSAPGALPANPSQSTTLMPPTLMPTTSATNVMPMPSTTSSLESSATSAGTVLAAASSPNNAEEAEPVNVSFRNCVVRGAMSLMMMRSVSRAEITLDNVCAMLEGRVLTIRAEDDRGVPPVVRMNLQRSTFATLQGFAAIQAAAATRAPLVLMRTAKLCAFWSPSAVSHLAIDGIADNEILDKLLLLRGEENSYDINIENLAQCRMTDGQHVQFPLNDVSEEWFRELGYENNLRWQNSLPPDRPMDQQLPSDYQLKDSMYMPGYR